MKFFALLLLSLFPGLTLLPARAEDDAPTASPAVAGTDNRFGPFDLFDHGSSYGQDVFPEPFLVDDSDLEQGEFRLDWLHTRAGEEHTDLFTGEVEYGFGLVTLELEVPIERDVDEGNKVSGFDNINPGIRAPLYEYVSPNGFINTTFGTGFEVGIPTHSQLSKNTEVVPKLFNDLSLGSHFTLQSIFGYSMLYGPKGGQGGLNTFEYGFVLGWTIQHKELAIPCVQQVIPIFELQGEKELDNGNAANNNVLGNLAVRFNMNSIGSIQPRLGVGFVFPITSAARQEVHGGIYTSLVFEF